MDILNEQQLILINQINSNEQQLILINQINSGELLPSRQELYEQICDEINKPKPACLYAQKKEEV